MAKAEAAQVPDALFDACCTRHRGVAHPTKPGFWSAVAVLGVVAVGGTLPIPLYAVYQQAFGFSMLGVAAVFVAFPVGLVAALVCLGCSSDRSGRRLVLLGALVLAAASALLFLEASSIGWLLGARFVSGLAVGLASPAASASIAELEPHRDLRRASLATAVVTVGGLGVGPLAAGLLAEYGGNPRTLPWQVYLGLVGAAVLVVFALPETVGRRASGFVGIRPRLIHLPQALRSSFAEAAASAAVGFAALGFFSSLVPSLLKAALHRPDHALGGAVVFSLYAMAVVGQLGGMRLGRSRAIALGLGGTAGGLVVVVAAFVATSVGLLVAGALVCGLGVGLAVMGGLGLVNAICPPEHRAEILSAYFAVTYSSAAVPVVLAALMVDHVGATTGVAMVAAWIGVLVLVVLAVRPRPAALRERFATTAGGHEAGAFNRRCSRA